MSAAGSDLAAKALAAELAKPLSPLEVAIGGSARPRTNEIDFENAMAIWEVLAYVMGQAYAPRPSVVVRWDSPKKTLARRWGERELARKVLGTTGRSSVTPPKCLDRYIERWEAAS